MSRFEDKFYNGINATLARQEIDTRAARIASRFAAFEILIILLSAAYIGSHFSFGTVGILVAVLVTATIILGLVLGTMFLVYLSFHSKVESDIKGGKVLVMRGKVNNKSKEDASKTLVFASILGWLWQLISSPSPAKVLGTIEDWHSGKPGKYWEMDDQARKYWDFAHPELFDFHLMVENEQFKVAPEHYHRVKLNDLVQLRFLPESRYVIVLFPVYRPP